MEIRWEVARVDDDGESILVNYIDDELEINLVVKISLVGVDLDDIEIVVQSRAPHVWFASRRKAMLPMSKSAIARKKKLETLVGNSGVVLIQ